MTSWNPRANDLFLKALEIQSSAEREKYLRESSAGDAALLAEVEELLEAAARAGRFLESPASGPVETVDHRPISENPGDLIGPYKLLEQIGEGGFGVVFMAEQTQPVRRKVALKVLKAGMDTRQVVARFEAERQALALMDHPNIAHIFDGGETVVGRPYFVMELVKGIPITDFCDQNRFALEDRLKLFVHVCQAVQHAHHKGIIHRDIKPSNVLVTLHDGTPVVKVIDFGIAKAAGQQLTDKTLFTNFAQMIGTPLYMSPEQAGLSGLDADTRSDIYSLGVLLYELLTGTTPFDKARFRLAAYDEIRRIIREEEPPRPSTRLTDSKNALPSIAAQRHVESAKLPKLVRGELDWIAMKALEKDRNRRYESANAFAADVQRYLHNEAVQACPPSSWYRVRKFARRNRGALTMAAVVTAAVVLVTAGGGWMLRDSLVRREQATAAIGTALDEASQRREQGDWRAGQTALRRADMFLTNAGRNDALQARRRQLDDDLKMLAGLEDARFLRTALKDERFDVKGAASAYADSFQTYQIPVLSLEPQEAADLIAASAVARDLLAALLYWATVEPDTAKRRKLLDVAQRAAGDSWFRQIPEILARVDWPGDDAWLRQIPNRMPRGDWAGLLRLAQQPGTLEQPPASLAVLSEWMYRADLQATVDFLRAAQRRYPDDFWINHALGWTLTRLKRPAFEEAAGFFRAALALSPESPVARLNLAYTLHKKGDLGGAIAEYRKALELRSDYAWAHNNLGVVLAEKGLTDEAIAEYREMIRLKPKNAGYAHNGLGWIFEHTGRLDEAMTEYRKAVEVNPEYALPHNNLGLALANEGRLDEAMTEYRKAIDANPQWALPHNNLGRVLSDKGQLDEALTEFKKSVELEPEDPALHINLGNTFIKLGRFDEAVAAYQAAIQKKPKYAEAHYNLGLTFNRLGRGDEAIAAYEKAIESKPAYAEAHVNRGVLLKRKGRLDDAIAAFEQAIRHKQDLVQAHENLGEVLLITGRFDEAIVACHKAIDLVPNRYHGHVGLAAALMQKDRIDEAIAEYREVIRLNKDHFMAHYTLGCLLCDHKHDYIQAIAAFKDARRIQPESAASHYCLGNAFGGKGLLDDAIGAYREAIRLKPDFADARNNLALRLRDKGKLDEALAEWQEALRRNPNHFGTHLHLGGFWCYFKLDYDRAIAEFRAAIRLVPTSSIARVNLGNALLGKGRVAEALASYQEAVFFEPNAQAYTKIAWLLATCSDANLRDPSGAVEAAQKAIALSAKDGLAWQALAWAQYRDGDWKAAIASMEKVKGFGSSGDSIEWFLLAMAHYQLGNRDEARRWYDRAVKWMDKNNPKDDELRRFRIEAAEVLKIK